MKILTLIAVYLPGYRAGGPVRTITNMVDQLGGGFEFWIITNDRDLNDTEPYPGVVLNKWVSVGKAQVYYVDLSFLSLRKLSVLIRDLNPDIVYLNSFFSSLNNKYLLIRRLGMISQIPTIVAPRGVFSPGALRLKSTKKRLYLQAVQRGGVLKGLRWQASSPMEKKDIIDSLPCVEESEIYVAANPVENGYGDSNFTDNGRDLSKERGRARFIFLSRISAKKNLKFALKLLHSLAGRIDFDIFGPIADPVYWDGCLQIIAGLPENVSVHVHGALPHGKVGKVLSDAHFFLFPTFGENFGHVIFEALRVGCPALISDQTPWNDLIDAKAGWVIPLEENKQWIEALQYCIDMNQNVFANYSINAKQYAMRWLSSSDALQANRNMFLDTVAGLDR